MPALSEKDNHLPEPVKRLKIHEALKGCGRWGVHACLKCTRNHQMFVYDDDLLRYTDWSETPALSESKCFRAENPENVELVLLPMDNRIVTGAKIKQGGVADCILMTSREISLVEFKTNATSISATSIVANIEKAISQLWRTYDVLLKSNCKAVGIDIADGMEIDFYVVFDKELDVTSATAERMELMTRFLENHSFPLSFDNSKTLR